MRVFGPVACLLIFAISTSFGQNCRLIPNINGDYDEYHCPPDYEEYGGVVIQLSPRDRHLQLDCYNLKVFRERSLIPAINATKVNDITISGCPFSFDNFKQFFDKFSIGELNALELRFSDLRNVSLGKSHFEGLGALKSLSLRSNNLVTLRNDVFEELPNLERIDLSDNSLTKLDKKLFLKNPNLFTLDMSGNKIESIPSGLFINLQQLVVLHMSNNKLTSLEDETFVGLKNLMSLQLRSNRINNVSKLAFAPLESLAEISLMYNQLQKIPEGLFSNSANLERVHMEHNSRLQLSSNVFANLTKLQDVSFADCSLSSIPDDIFQGSTAITRLRLQQNRLEKIQFLNGLTELKDIDLSINKIEDLSDSFDSLKSLEVLNLQSNLVTAVEEQTFRNLTNLRELYLGLNLISGIHVSAFENNRRLSIVSLHHNRISFKQYNNSQTPFSKSVNLERIDLSHNFITDVEDDFMLNKVRMLSLDLSFNNITELKIFSLLTASKEQVSIFLRSNKITSIDFKRPTPIASNTTTSEGVSFVYLENNPIQCDCNAYDLWRYFRAGLDKTLENLIQISPDNLTCAGPPLLRGIPVQKLSPDVLQCPVQEAVENWNCSCSWRAFDTCLVVNCSYRNLTEVPQLVLPVNETRYRFNQTEVHLEGNRLSRGPPRNYTGYRNVTKLFLSHNKIKDISWVPPKIEVLKIDNNEINHMTFGVLKTLNNSRVVSLEFQNNPWTCDCDSANFSNFIRENANKTDSRRIFCSNSTQLLVDNNVHSLCSQFNPVPFVITFVLTVLFLLGVALALYYRYEVELKVWLFARGWFLRWITEEDLDQDKSYDAFISYSTLDEDFVTEELVPGLEQAPNHYKLCLHYRDFVPGESIADQIVDSVNRSKRTVVVLSPNFVQSVWGKMEFRTAHTNAMSEGRARVIVILCGDVDVESLDDSLKSYLKTNTYVKWGDPWFWNKLRFALPHPPTVHSKKIRKGTYTNINGDHVRLQVQETIID